MSSYESMRNSQEYRNDRVIYIFGCPLFQIEEMIQMYHIPRQL